MSDPVVAAIISAVVALGTAGTTAFFSWRQTIHENARLLHEIERGRIKWLTDLKADYSKEIHKARLEAYPQMLQIIGGLSTRAVDPLTPEKANEIATKINDWLYSAGGLYATKETRGALLGIREACLRWQEGSYPPELYGFRDNAILLLRRDLDIKGLESYDFSDLKSVLNELKEDTESIK